MKSKPKSVVNEKGELRTPQVRTTPEGATQEIAEWVNWAIEHQETGGRIEVTDLYELQYRLYVAREAIRVYGDFRYGGKENEQKLF